MAMEINYYVDNELEYKINNTGQDYNILRLKNKIKK